MKASHSAKRYLGDLAGYNSTNEVMTESGFNTFIQHFMDKDVSPILDEIPGVNLEQYKQTLIQRFSNQKMADQLSRLCMDGSSKIPKFLVPTINQLIKQDRPLERVALIIASWALYINSQDLDNIKDPMAQRLKDAVSEPLELTDNFLNLHDIFGHELINSDRFVDAFERAVMKIESFGVMVSLEALDVT